MSFFGDDIDDSLALFPQTAADTLIRDSLSNTGRTTQPDVTIGILVVVIRVQKDGGAIVEIDPEKDAVAVAEFIRGKGKGSRSVR